MAEAEPCESALLVRASERAGAGAGISSEQQSQQKVGCVCCVALRCVRTSLLQAQAARAAIELNSSLSRRAAPA